MEVVLSTVWELGEAFRPHHLTQVLQSSWLSRSTDMPVMRNTADHGGRLGCLDKSATLCWIVHRTAKSAGVGGALVLGTSGLGARVLMFDRVLGSGGGVD